VHGACLRHINTCLGGKAKSHVHPFCRVQPAREVILHVDGLACSSGANEEDGVVVLNELVNQECIANDILSHDSYILIFQIVGEPLFRNRLHPPFPALIFNDVEDIIDRDVLREGPRQLETFMSYSEASTVVVSARVAKAKFIGLIR
jgi:hypothetical protein